jgi:NAD dependent epimerase/dehydratase
MKKILVTGADGFIGSHLVEELVLSGYSVKAFVQYNSFNSWGWIDDLPKNIKNEIEIFSGDIRDPNGVSNAVSNCDNIFHLAALIAIPFSYHSPDSYIDTNIKGTLNVLQSAQRFNVEKIIHTSTSEVYGTAQYVPIDELHPLVGQSPYSASKIGADQLALSFYRSFQTPVGIIRPFNTYGPRQSNRAVIPSIITQLLNGVKQIKLGQLHPTRDFSYVKDTVDGFIAALNSKMFVGDVFNLGSNFEISILDTVNIISKIMNVNVEILNDSERIRPDLSEVERLFSNNSKAINQLNWSPNFGGIDGFKLGIESTIKWFSNTENLSKYKSDIYNI